MLRVTTVGTGTAFPQGDRGPTCQLVRHHDRSVVVDMGSGALQKLAARGVTPVTMDALLLTHAHLDHVADFFPMLFALHVPLYDRSRPLPVYASAQTIEIVARVRAAWGGWLDVPDGTFAWRPTAPGDRLDVAGLEVEVGDVAHDASSVGYRFTAPDGRVLSIPGDSGPCGGLVELCRGADLALVELSVPRMCPMDTHMHPAAMVELVERSGLKRLAVLHRYPAAITNDAVPEVLAAVDVPVVVPSDGDTLDVG